VRRAQVVSPTDLPAFTASGAVCGNKDGDWICVDRLSDAAFRSFVQLE
jgi:hypothetical protein